MTIENNKHIEFYDWQIQVLEDEWMNYANTSMNILWQERRLFVGRIWGVDEARGNLILRFKRNNPPRMKGFYALCLVDAKAGINPKEWLFSYKSFRSDNDLSGKNTEVKTLFPLKSDDDKWTFIGTRGADYEFVKNIKELYLDKQLHPLIVLAETDPPINYLLNLRDFIKKYPKYPIINLPVNLIEDNWKPINLDNENDVLPDLIGLLKNRDKLIIQGPPGTGKSYLVAQLCSHFLDKNKSIAITALTNKALVEVAEKEGLKKHLNQSKVFKTNLSADEQKTLPRLEVALDISPNHGELLLSTYYKLSEKVEELIANEKRYDILIIEEASQAFLATIAAFDSIAEKILIIGDYKQLPPVVIKQEKAKKIHPDIYGIVYGLQTFSFNNPSISYRLTKTRRLTHAGAKLTGKFYNNSLLSIAESDSRKTLESKFSILFDENGGTTIVKLPIISNTFDSKDILQFVNEMVQEILPKNPLLEVAILTPNIYIEKKLYQNYSKHSDDYKRITISTIHKIQGLTVDLTILFLAMDNPNFDLDENIFNVATSRARQGTLIVTNKSVDLVSNISVEVRQYLLGCRDVTTHFINKLNQNNNTLC
jgi:superfamily I DNA and/or RNA helicase